MAYSFVQEGNNIAVFQDGKRISTSTPQNAALNYGYGNASPAPTPAFEQLQTAAGYNQPGITSPPPSQTTATQGVGTAFSEPPPTGLTPAQQQAYLGVQQAFAPAPTPPPTTEPTSDNLSAQTQALQSQQSTQPSSSSTTTTTSGSSTSFPEIQLSALPPPPSLANTADQYLQSYLQSISPSSDETSLTGQLGDINSRLAGVTASRDLGIQGVNEQPIATPFLTGQSAAITNRAAVQAGALGAQAVPLQTQLAQAQAKRQTAADIAKTNLAYAQNKDEAANTLAERQYEMALNQRQQDYENQVAAQKFAAAQQQQQIENQQAQQKQSNVQAAIGSPSPSTSSAGTTTTVAGINSGKDFVSGTLNYSSNQYKADQATLLSTTIKDAQGNPNRGADGYVNPAVYLQGLQNWTTNGGLQSDYLQLFPIKDYINPANTWSEIIALGGGTKPKATTTKTTTPAASLY